MGYIDSVEAYSKGDGWFQLGYKNRKDCINARNKGPWYDFACLYKYTKAEEAKDVFSSQNSKTPVYHVTERVRNAKGETIGIKYEPVKKAGILKSLLKLLKIVK